MGPNEFECGLCLETFTKAWTDEEAFQEAEEVFGSTLDSPVFVCDECYDVLMAWGKVTGTLDKERARLANL